MSTTKGVAEGIVLRGYGVKWKTDTELVAAIDTALIARREQRAKIAEVHSATDCDGPDCGVVIAAAIRQGSTDADTTKD